MLFKFSKKKSGTSVGFSNKNIEEIEKLYALKKYLVNSTADIKNLSQDIARLNEEKNETILEISNRKRKLTEEIVRLKQEQKDLLSKVDDQKSILINETVKNSQNNQESRLQSVLISEFNNIVRGTNKNSDLTSDEINLLRKTLFLILDEYNVLESGHLSLDTSPEVLEKLIFNLSWDPYGKVSMEPFDTYMGQGEMGLIKKLDLTGVNFSKVNVQCINFTGSKGVIIQPQNVWQRSLDEAVLTDTKLVGSLNGVSTLRTVFVGCDLSDCEIPDYKMDDVKKFIKK